MQFLNVILLAGIAAFVIPLMIHLLSRSRYRTVPWGAMHLITFVVQENKRRVRLEKIVLLLVRCAIPALLAFSLAQPVLSGWRTLAGNGPTSTLIVLDNSYSMQAGNDVRSNFQSGIDEVGRVLGDLPPGSDAQVLLAGAVMEPLLEHATAEIPKLVDHMSTARAESGSLCPLESVATAGAMLSEMRHSRQRLILVSDFQRADWEEFATSAGSERLSSAIEQLGKNAEVTFFNVNTGRQAIPNVAVQNLDLSQTSLGVGQTVQATATLHNYGTDPVHDLRVYFRVDGQQQSAAQVSLASKGISQSTFSCRFDTPGSHLLEVEADIADLKADNLYAASLQVADRLPVLLIDGGVSTQGALSETVYLRPALMPFQSAGEHARDLISAETVTFEEFRQEQLNGKRAVVLANVPRLNEAQVRAIGTFVQQGGGLLIFTGDKTDVDHYDAALYAGDAGLLPARLGPLAGSHGDVAKQSTLMLEHFEHPALFPFNDLANGDLSRAKIFQWRQLQANESTESSLQHTKTLLRLASGEPLLMEKQYGQGLVVLCATSCNDRWSNLPLRPWFVPLMQRLVTSIARNVLPPRNVLQGAPLVAYVDPDLVGKTLNLSNPDGSQRQLTVLARDGQGVVEYFDAKTPGAYVLSDEEHRVAQFVVNTDRAHESNLEMLSESELRNIADKVGATAVTTGEQLARQEKGRRFGTEMFEPLLAVVIMLLFVEQWLTRRFAKGIAA